MIPLTKPFVPVHFSAALHELLESGWLTEGDVTENFEDEVKAGTNFKHAIACPNATQGLEMVLRNSGIREKDLILVPNFTHPATALAVMNVGARPILCDVSKYTFNMGKILPEYLEDIQGVITVSQFGNQLDYDTLWSSLKSINTQRFILVEDAACSVGVFGHPLYKISRDHIITAIVYSFHPRKIITTGEGGMILTNFNTLNSKLQSYKNFGVLKSNFVEKGGNYKLSNVSAQLGLCQMMYLKSIVEDRQRTAKYYMSKLSNLPIKFQHVPYVTNYQTFCIIIEKRDELREYLKGEGIESQVGSYALSKLSVFKECATVHDLSNSEFLADHTLALPLWYGMGKDVVNVVTQTIKQFFRRL
jgi:dTDP-4-amino-4,6-dideoxygalactose transaminase